MEAFTVAVEVNSRFMPIARRARGLAGMYTSQAARQVEEIAKINVPFITGNLHDGINAVQMGILEWQVLASSMDGGADREYAAFVEEGTSRMAAQPYLKPALDDVEPEFLDRMSRIVD